MAEEVLYVVLPANHEPTEMMEPSDQLGWTSGALRDAERSSHCRSARQSTIQTVAVVGFVADQSRWEGVEGSSARGPFDELAFVRRSAFNTNSERKTVIIGESKDFRPFAAFGRPDRKAPFFAPAKEASMNASSRSSFPRACNSSASTRKTRSSLPARTHCWKRRWPVWYSGYF